MVLRVPGEVDEHVHAVRADAPREPLIVEAGRVDPLVGELAQVLGDLVGAPCVGVADDLDGSAVVLGDDRLDEPRDRVQAEVRRDVADAQAPLRVEVCVEVRGRDAFERRQRVGEALGPAEVLGGERLRVVVRDVREAEQQVRVRAAVRGLQLDRVPVGARCLVQPRLALERDAEVRPRLGIAGVEGDRAAVVGDGLGEAQQPLECRAEAVVEDRSLRLVRDRARDQLDGLFVLVALVADDA